GSAGGRGAARGPSGGGGEVAPSWSPDGRKIAFTANSNGSSNGVGDIFTMNPDGSGQTQLTNDPADDYGPCWSPDSSKIAFHSNRTGNYEIYEIGADGSNLQN